ncbi:MAG: hypothetical protein QOE61_4472, partial [Micromonosporaceae bacterium]|nr:hypothetical protein [Micromonosporaceae bacterium]
MITRDDAEQTVTRWALTQTRRAGYELTPMLHEFDLGFVVWTRQPASVRAEPGDGTRTVIDRETGEFTHYSALPVEVVEGMYRDDRASRPAAPATVDRAAELRRQNERR